MRFVLPIILITIALIVFFVFLSPSLQEVKALQVDVDSYNEALDNSKALEYERDKLTKQFTSFDPDDLRRLETLLPNSINNIRLILEIESLASPYGMVLRDVRYDTVRETSLESENNAQPGPAGVIESSKGYGEWELEFSTEGSYTNFLQFLRELEANLRLIDLVSIQFASITGESAGANFSTSEVYKYSFKLKTYWLKNVFNENR